MLTQFEYPLSDRTTITKQANFQPLEADSQFCLRTFIAKAIEPLCKWFFSVFSLITKYINHLVF
ncbi:hypothetical protein Thiosp_01942 [Thiorhodovibrio litoralis]|nr:hypothetical protein Thiosp_01942 [Thiorhodovibrio litoralis]